MTLANISNQLLKSQGNDTTTVAANYPITGDGSTQLPLGLDEDYSGADGESLTFNITDIDNGHQVTISGIQGSSSFNVLNGQDGANGVNGLNGADGQSVTFDIANIANGHSVTLSGAQGSTSFDVMNGQNGVDGISPAFRFVENEDKVIVFVSGAQGEESFTLYDGETHTYSAGPNIDITNDVISGKDWSDEINAKLDTTAFTLPNSANWNNTYNTVDSNSANWSNDTTYTAGSNINITDNVISGKDWSDELNAKLDTTAFSLPNSANWNNTYDTVSANSAQWSNDTTYTAGPNIDITNDVISGKDWTDTIAAASAYAASQAKGGVAISGKYSNNGSTITEDCSAFGMYEQHNSPGSYQLMATANNASWHGYGYTMSTPENLLMSNVSSVAQNYAASAVSSHIRLIHYPDITFSTVRNTFNAGGIVVPYETTQGYGKVNSFVYSFVSSSVADSTSSYKFKYIGTNGYATNLTVSSYNNGAVTGCITANEKLYATPNDVALVDRIVLVATSGDIPASGESDNKVYIVTGTE